jgi:glycosyltransferase involved in cell wall biosynthesis
MKILMLSPVFPYPPADGDRIRIFNIIKELAEKGGHRIHLVTFAARGEEDKISRIRKYVESVDVVHISKPAIIMNSLRGIFSPVPLNTAAYKSVKMERAVEAAVKKYSPDIIFAYRLRMAQYAVKTGLPRVIDYVDSLALFMKRSLAFERHPGFLLYYGFDAPRVLEYERKTAGEFSTVFINSEDDRDFLGSTNITVAPNGAAENVLKKQKKQGAVVTAGLLGNFSYRPNFEAANFLIKKVWKKINDSDKNIRLVIAGKGSARFAKSAGGGIVIKDYVPDISAELSGWDMAVIPVRYGAGRQNKLMDCWARGVPVIAAPFAASGVYGRDGYNMLTASTPDEFAEKITALKKNAALGKKLAANGAATLKKYFRWGGTGKIINRAVLTAVKNFKKR